MSYYLPTKMSRVENHLYQSLLLDKTLSHYNEIFELLFQF